MSKLLERMKAATQRAEEIAREKQSGTFYDLQDGTTVIRLLPSLEFIEKLESDTLADENGVMEQFYKTITYHYVQTGRDSAGKAVGKYLYTRRYYELQDEKNGATIQEQDPLDYFANMCYKSEDKKIKNLYGSIKRKRFYVMNALVYDANGKNPKLVNLRDKSNNGALVKQLCKILGQKFVLDTNLPLRGEKDENEEASGQFESTVVAKDILSTESGFKVAIVKKTVTKPTENGDPIKVPDYSETKTSKEPTPLTAEEQELFLARKPLSSLFEYCSFEEAEKALDEFISYNQVDLNKLAPATEDEKPKKKESKPKEKAEVNTPATSREPIVHEELSDEDAKILGEFE